jgi:hypothetical protein
MFCEYLHNSSHIDEIVRLGLVLGPSSTGKSIATPLNLETIRGWRVLKSVLLSARSLLDTCVARRTWLACNLFTGESRDSSRLILDISDATN